MEEFKINFDGTEIPIPTKTSQLENDSDFITPNNIPSTSQYQFGGIKMWKRDGTLYISTKNYRNTLSNGRLFVDGSYSHEVDGSKITLT